MNALQQGGGAAAPAPAAADPPSAHLLPAGEPAGDFRLLGLIGEGASGIVYRADQPPSRRECAVREYLPVPLASRVAGTERVQPRSGAHAAAFDAGRLHFLDGARVLMRLNHPALAKVLARWEANGTAYQAMPVYEGPTLAQALARRGGPSDEQELLGWLLPLLEALRLLHAQPCLHRGITPWNIVLAERGPVLLDLGGPGDAPPVSAAARRYAAPEVDGARMQEQGPWSDLYALAAVACEALTGHPPPPAAERMVDDRLQPLSRLAGPACGAPLLATLDAALALRPEDRPRSAADFLQRLQGGGPASQSPASPREALRIAPAAVAHAQPAVPSPSAAGRRDRGVVLVALVAALAGAALLWLWPADRETAPPPAPHKSAPMAAARSGDDLTLLGPVSSGAGRRVGM